MKTLRFFSLLACMMLCSMTINAQIQVEEGSFKRIDGYVMTDKHDHTDMNDAPMALIKITTKNIFAEQRTKFSFKGNAITYFDVQFEPGEIYLYLSAQAATFIEIIHEDYGKTEYWLPYTLCDFCAYEMVVEYTPKKEEAELIVSGNMDNSLIYIDGKLLGIKEAKKMSEVGATHTWKIVCDDYQTESGTVTLNGKTEIYKVLKPVIVDESLDGMKKKTKKQNRFFLGINAGVGAGFYSYSSEIHDTYGDYNLYEEGGDFSIPFNAGVDFAFRLSDSFYLGAYGSIGMLPWGEGDYLLGNRLSPSFGLLTLFNQKNEKAIIIGAGTCIPSFWEYLGVNFRIGYKFKNNLYLFGEFTTCSYSSFWNDYKTVYDPYEDYYEEIEIYKDVDASTTSFFLHFGYRIF